MQPAPSYMIPECIVLFCLVWFVLKGAYHVSKNHLVNLMCVFHCELLVFMLSMFVYSSCFLLIYFWFGKPDKPKHHQNEKDRHQEMVEDSNVFYSMPVSDQKTSVRQAMSYEISILFLKTCRVNLNILKNLMMTEQLNTSRGNVLTETISISLSRFVQT